MSLKRECMIESPEEELARLRAENAAYKAKRERWPFTPACFVQPPLDDVCGKILPAAWKRCQAMVPAVLSGSVDRLTDDWKRGFYRAFAALATIRRAEEPDRQRETAYWYDQIEDREKIMGFGSSSIAYVFSMEFFLKPHAPSEDLA
jgi:hypothetical protein